MKLKLIAGLVGALAVVGMAGSAEAQGSKRPLIAVMDFDYGTIDNWWGQYDIGKGMADQVVNALLEDGSFRVIERKKLDTVLAEQDFAQSDRADPSAAKMAKMGKVLGVKYILAGLDHEVLDREAGRRGAREGHRPRRLEGQERGGPHRARDRRHDRRDPDLRQGAGRVEQGRRRRVRERRVRRRDELGGVAQRAGSARPRRRPATSSWPRSWPRRTGWSSPGPQRG